MMAKNNLQEKLVSLYLRLNGYTTTGLILHSSKERSVDGEIDIIGVRFKEHFQPDRLINCSEHLEIPNDTRIDIIVGEVKGGKNPLQFNESLRLHSRNVIKLFQWMGICYENDLILVAQEFMNAIQIKEIQKPDPFPIVRYQDISVRPILFAPDRPTKRNNQLNFINGSDMISFCWDCFRPENKRISCETNYRAINNWGEQFERLVGYFKNPDKVSPGGVEDLYDHFKQELHSN